MKTGYWRVLSRSWFLNVVSCRSQGALCNTHCLDCVQVREDIPRPTASPVFLSHDQDGVSPVVSPGVVCVAVSVAADVLVAGSEDGRMAVWNLTDRQLVHSLFGHTGLSESYCPSGH